MLLKWGRQVVHACRVVCLQMSKALRWWATLFCILVRNMLVQLASFFLSVIYWLYGVEQVKRACWGQLLLSLDRVIPSGSLIKRYFLSPLLPCSLEERTCITHTLRPLCKWGFGLWITASRLILRINASIDVLRLFLVGKGTIISRVIQGLRVEIGLMFCLYCVGWRFGGHQFDLLHFF